MKMWAHHMPNLMKNVTLNALLPSLPRFGNIERNRSYDSDPRLGNKSFSCVAGHDVVDFEQTLDETRDDPYATDWPHWPSIMHFRETGYGPYPFWQFGPPKNDWDLNMSFDEVYAQGVEVEVWHSTPLQATKFYHQKCWWGFLGYDELEHRACGALMFNRFGVNGTWYLYTANETTKASDDYFCCESSCGSVKDYQLGTINRKFMDWMKYVGEVDHVGDYYKGKAKRYVMAMRVGVQGCPGCSVEPSLPLDVWYETDLNGLPLRFGELGTDILLNGRVHDLDLPLVYEDIDPSSFTDPQMQRFSNSVFDVPKICTSNPHGCHPGRGNQVR